MANVREFIQKYRPWTVQFIFYLNGQYYKDNASVLDNDAIDYLSQSETKGIFGHSLITLPNEHLFLFGGVSYSFNPYVKSTFDINEDPFSNKTIIINPFPFLVTALLLLLLSQFIFSPP